MWTIEHVPTYGNMLTRPGAINGCASPLEAKVSQKSVLARLDRLLCWCVIAGGVAQWALTPVFFPIIHEPAAWWFNGGITLILLGGVNLLRVGHGAEVENVRRFAIAANFVVSLFYAAMLVGLWYKFVRYPFAFVGPAGLFALTALSLRPLWRGGAVTRA